MSSKSVLTSPAVRQLKAFAGILGRTSGGEALAKGLTPYLGLLIFAGVVFGGNGMHTRDITHLARSAPGFRLALLAVWLLISMPAARALLASRSGFYLRGLPVPLWSVLPVVMGYMVLVEAPWVWLWTVGEGPAGMGAVAVAMAGHALLLGRPRRISEAVCTLALLAMTVITARLTLWNLLGWPVAAVTVWRAWVSAPGRGQTRGWALVRSGQPRLVAQAAAYFATLNRGQRPLLLRWLWLAGSGALSGVLVVRNNQPLDMAQAGALWLTCLLPGMLLGAAGLVGPLARSAARGSWLLLSCGVSSRQRRLAFALALLPMAVVLGAALGVLSAVALAWFSWRSILRLLLLGLLASGCTVAVTTTFGIRAIQGKGRDAARLLVTMAVASGLLMLTTWLLGYLGIVVASLLAAALGLMPETEGDSARRSARIAQQPE